MAKPDFNPNETTIGRITSKSSFKPMAVATIIGTVGAALIGLNAILGLNIRPAFAFEIERLVASRASALERLEKVERAADATSRTILQLNKEQYGLRTHQIDQEKRDLRRELAEHQSRAQDFRDKGEPVPGWVRDSIADTETSIEELRNEKRGVEKKLLELER